MRSYPQRANASPLHYAANIAIIGIFQKTKVLRFAPYFDIRISNLVAAKGCAKLEFISI